MGPLSVVWPFTQHVYPVPLWAVENSGFSWFESLLVACLPHSYFLPLPCCMHCTAWTGRKQWRRTEDWMGLLAGTLTHTRSLCLQFPRTLPAHTFTPLPACACCAAPPLSPFCLPKTCLYTPPWDKLLPLPARPYTHSPTYLPLCATHLSLSQHSS